MDESLAAAADALVAASVSGFRLRATRRGARPSMRRYSISGGFEFCRTKAPRSPPCCAEREARHARARPRGQAPASKALALAAVMENRGEIVACDGARKPALRTIEAARPSLAHRSSGADHDRDPNVPWRGPPGPGLFELRIFVDAPCTGSGTWRRQPELKWRLHSGAARGTPAAFPRTGCSTRAPCGGSRPRGILVYATCSILPNGENEDRVAAFLARTPGFAVLEAAPSSGPRQTKGSDGPFFARSPSSQGLSLRNMGEFFRATPFSTGTDGFFCAVLGRT